ncbi:MAG TPA: ATP-binding protein [Steroidobacteraceae bacterium]|nr:ATP-binding protein [Steroidobacteraceae bacterium]
MLLRSSFRSLPRAEARGPFAPFRIPMALSWALLGYAILAVAAGGAFTVLRIHADYLEVMQEEDESLRGVTAALTSATQTMLDHGVGAARAAASDIRATGGLDGLPAQAVGLLLQRNLSGGTYVRFLFLEDAGRYVLASRTRVRDGASAPSYLPGVTGEEDTWVGSPMHDPEDAARWVVPIARRVHTGLTSLGWAGALLSFAGLQQLNQRFGERVSQLGLIALDGTILANVGDHVLDRYTGRNVAQSDLFRRGIANSRGGIVQGLGAITRVPMIFAYFPVSGYPVFVAAGQTRAAALAGWHVRRRQMIAATAAFSALILILTAFLGHYMNAWRTRERHYTTLVDSARFGVFLLEGDRFVDANRTAAVMFGLKSERTAVGLTPWELSPELQPSGRTSRELARERILAAAREGGSTFEWMHKRVDTGESFPAEVDLSSLSTEGTTLALAIVHDVTARKHAEEQLRQVTAELMRSQDEERRRIGRDLHDSTGQTLAALEIDLARLEQDAPKLSESGREQLDRCVRLARQCSEEIRTASYLLHPPLLDELGLSSALRWLADGLRARGALEPRLQLPEQLEGVAPEEELALFRVAQEALTNVQRHSTSPWVAIRLHAAPSSLVLEIEDAGRGFQGAQARDPASSGRSAGVGVAGMQERIRQLGGTLTVESTPGGGTLVRACIPLSGPAGAQGDAKRMVAS